MAIRDRRKFMKIQFSFKSDSKLLEMIEKLATIGYSKPEIVKAGIRMVFKKEFPPYAVNKKMVKDVEEAMTPEEVCTDILGGEVIEENGVKFCTWKQGNFINRAPLSAIRDQL